MGEKASSMNPKKIYLLIHGAWHDRGCWDSVVSLLKLQGHQGVAIDLPGHGKDQTSFLEISLKTYVEAVINVMGSFDRLVTLVGHSMGGVVISQVAELFPEKIEKLIYIAAFIPQNRGSLMQEARKSKTAGVSTEILIDEENNAILLKKTDRLKELFFNQCPPEVADFAFAELKSTPFRPFTDLLSLSKEKFGTVKKIYVECLFDQLILPKDQERMAIKAGCQLIKLNADHSPFYSKPEELVEILSSLSS